MTDRNTSKTRTWMIFGAAAAFVLIAGVAAVLLSGSDESTVADTGGDDPLATTISETRPVTLTGTPLPATPEQGADVALGLPMPELSGQSFDGTPVEIKNDGRPKIIMFLTHW